MKAVGELHAAQAPSHFTFASHAAMFVSVTPGIAGVRAPYLNPKFAKIVRVHNEGRRPFGPAAFELDGANIARGFARTGYRTLGSGALPWFDPAKRHGEVLTDGFERFFYTASLFRFKDQVRWLDGEIEGAGQRPVFAFLNVGETHVPYCEGFRMPAADGWSGNTGGRRPKASKGGNRDGGRRGAAAGAMGI
jgi:hypothetical protein